MRLSREDAQALGLVKKRGKCGSTRCEADGFNFDSKKERDFYAALKLRRANKDIDYFLRQVPFHLPGGVVYRCDFMVVDRWGKVSYIDVKGHKMREYLTKKKLVEHHFGVQIEER